MGLRQRLTLVALVAGSALQPTLAAADARPSTAQLHYETGPGAETCPSTLALEAAVRARLGYDPFDVTSEQTVLVSVRRDHGQLVGRVSIHLADGTVREREPLTSSGTDCFELASALTLAISIAIDPLTFVRPVPAPAPPEAAHSPTASPSPPLVPPRASEDRGPGWEVGAGGLASLGALPAPSLGLLLFGGVVAGFGRLDLEARYDFPASRSGPEGSAVEASLFLVTLAPCWTPRPMSFCGLASLGALPGSGSGVDNRETADVFYGALGVRAAIELPTTGRARGRLQIDGYAPLRPTTLRIVGTDVWTTPPVFGTLSLVLAVHSI